MGAVLLRGRTVDIHSGTVSDSISPSVARRIVCRIPAGHVAPSAKRSRPHELDCSNGFWSSRKTTQDFALSGHFCGAADEGAAAQQNPVIPSAVAL